MDCPKCGAPMEAVEFGEVVVDRCTNCRGIWFDMLEKEELKAREGSEIIDSGDPAVGRKYDTVDRIDCPVCKVPMLRMVDVNQPHIHFESCPTCYGAFFDAGEFRDFKQESMLDLLRDLMAGERK